ncbi:MAG: NAD(P)H-hydrate dehydratase [Campylobacterota bacterium]|nr:NAD(P)H-hydrate dehydratase [Campylobacterota bacterium]
MQKLFNEVGSLDKRCYEIFNLSEDILMEHAANGIANYIKESFRKNSKIIIACGSGNNGADGITLARLLHIDYDVSIFFAKEPSSDMAILQTIRSRAIGVKELLELTTCDIVVDAVMGTGFKGDFDKSLTQIMQKLNLLYASKIACDVPSGLKQTGECVSDTFKADITLTMGALKKSLFLDEAKEFVGVIKVIDLGLPREVYENSSNWNLLDLEDLKLPYRTKKSSHKGTFGHLALASGEKLGASVLSAESALRFGTGLVTLVGFKESQIPHTIMSSHRLPSNTTALALGMGLGSEFSDTELLELLDNKLPLIADADIFYMPIIKEILKRDNVVITPHPKEFVALLKMLNLADIDIQTLQKNRFKYAELFSNSFANITLLLKGANVIIAQNNQFFINPHGISALAKGGSGDVLSGLIGALLAQNYTALDSAINASLAHTKLAQNYKGADFSLTPNDLIEGIGNL